MIGLLKEDQSLIFLRLYASIIYLAGETEGKTKGYICLSLYIDEVPLLKFFYITWLYVFDAL